MLLGVLSILQAVFLPGYLALRAVRAKTGSFVETAVVSCALSLTFNYMFALVLTLFGLYGRTAVLMLLAVEGAAIIALLVRANRRAGGSGPRIPLRYPRLNGWSSAYSVSVSLTLTVLAALLAMWRSLRFNVIEGWDALFTWNHWAYAWYTGALPRPVHLYPQLMPANWSMMYLINGSFETQMFPLALIPFFGVGIFAMFMDLGLRRRRQEYLYALIVCAGMAVLFKGSLVEVLRGYAELPLAFMTASAFYLLELRDDRRPRNWRELALPLVIAAGATVTKFNAGYVLAVIVGLAVLGHLANRANLTTRDWLTSVFGSVLVVAAIPGSWYVMKFLDFAAGRDRSNSADLSRVVNTTAGGPSLAGRLLFVVSQVPGGWISVALMVVAVVLAWRVRRARWVALLVLVPYSLLWAFFLGYDMRNWMLMIPVAAYVVAMGYGWLAERGGVTLRLEVQRAYRSVPRSALFVGSAAVVVCLAGLAVAYPPRTVVAREVEQQRLIGSPGLNGVLYSALSTDPSIRGKFLTDYWQLKVLPEFRGEGERSHNTPGNRIDFVDPTTFTLIDYTRGAMPASTDGYDYLLLSDLGPDEVQSQIESAIDEGRYEVVAEYEAEPFQLYREHVKVRLIRIVK